MDKNAHSQLKTVLSWINLRNNFISIAIKTQSVNANYEIYFNVFAYLDVTILFEFWIWFLLSLMKG